MNPQASNEAVPALENRPGTPAKPKLTPKLALVMALQMVIGATLGGLSTYWVLKSGGSLAPPETFKPLMLLIAISSIVLALPVHLIAHELGHALVGQWVGGRILRIVIGPWRWERRKSGFHRQRVRSLKGIGGFAQTLLPADSRFRRAMTLMLLGGPLANLAIAGVALAMIIGNAPWPLRVFSIGFIAFGLLLGVINLLPFRTSGFLTDGAQILRLWTQPAQAEHQRRLLRVARASLDGLRPREWDPADIAALDHTQTRGPERLSALWVRAAVALDQGDRAQARLWLESGLREWDSYPDGFRQSLALNAAEISAELDRDAKAARDWLSRCEGGVLLEFQVDYVRACIADLENQPRERAAALVRMRAGLDDTLFRGDERVYREKLAALENASAASAR